MRIKAGAHWSICFSARALIWVKVGRRRLDDATGMEAVRSAAPMPLPRIRLRDVVVPKEHGSWSLAFEPLALGLSIAPSAAGAWLAVAVLAGFFARRPLKIVLRDRDAMRRHAAARALVLCGAAGLAACAFALGAGGVHWTGWLLPFAGCGAAFLFFDLQNNAREERAEILGAAAFASVTPALVAAAGAGAVETGIALIAMMGRAVPSVMYVRACVRGGKTGEYRCAPALLMGGVACAAGVGAWSMRCAPAIVPIALGFLFVRSAIRLARRQPVRARTLGLQELAIGIAYIAAVSAAWRI